MTGKGIKLGLSEAQLIKILGLPQERTSIDEAVVFDYRIKDPEAGELFGYTSDLYYGTYTRLELELSCNCGSQRADDLDC